MVGSALVMIVPSRADISPVIMRDAMMAQNRHVRMVGLASFATCVGDTWRCIKFVLNGGCPVMLA
jgi:hypothetical protein